MIRRASLLLCWALMLAPASLQAQADADADRPAFSLSTTQTFSSREHPSVYLTFRRVTQLDFRVYKVRDPVAFFTSLRDPHQLGSERVPVPTERSWIERLSDWKRSQRREIRSFVRDQVTPEYRAMRRASGDRAVIAQRVVLDRATFAQAPLLNPEQLVTAWREVLPPLRDAEMRRIPLDIDAPGLYVVEAVSGALRAYTVAVVSDLGLVTKVAPGQMVVFAANRLTGEPQAGCGVRVLANQRSIADGTTAADGVVDLRLPVEQSDSLVTLAQCRGAIAVSDPGGWMLRNAPRELLGYVYTDKPIYRPGHTTHVKAILRWRERDAVMRFDRTSVELTASDPNDKVIYRRSHDVDEFGAVSASFQVPHAAALGHYTLRIAAGDEQALGAFEVQEYRRPEFEVIVTPASRFVVQGQPVAATVRARYYFGQPVAHARVRYAVNRQPYYSPYRWSDSFEDGGGGGYWYGDTQNAVGELRLDAEGRGQITLPAPVDEQQRDYSLRIEAQVADASGREVSGTGIVHATYGSFLLSAEVSGYVFRAGQPVTVSIRAVDYTGNPRGDVPVALTVEHLVYRAGYYVEPTVTKVGDAATRLDSTGRGEVHVTLGRDAGTYRIRAAAGESGRSIASETIVWATGPQETRADEGDRYLELLADKRAYAVGDVARVAVRGEVIAGPVLLTKEGQHVTWYRLVTARAGDAMEIPIEAGDVGDIYANVVYMRDGRLHRAERRLSVPAHDRALQIELTPERAVAKPQEPGVFHVSIRNAAGAPVRAQVSIGIIDEGVYAIRPDRTPDPVRFFHRREYSRVATTFSRDYYFSGYSGTERLQLARRKRRPFTLADFKGDREVQPQVRKDFPDAIHWVADLTTDASGTAKVAVKYPDALTTWRLTARAVTADTLLGAGVVRTTTTKDLIVRVITPRFLTQGDEVVVPTIVHNYLDREKHATVTFAASGLQPAADARMEPTMGAIDAAGERRDEWRLTAPAVGRASVTAAARTDADADAVELPIPVLPKGLRREAGSSGTLSGAADHSIEVGIPAGSNPAARAVRVSLAPSMAGSLLGALDFLTSYPYACTEQTLSTFVPNLVVTRTLAQLGLTPTERLSTLDRQVADGLRRLLDYQHDDGGWGWWKTDENHPFMTAYALYGLAEARRAGHPVDSARFSSATRALLAMYREHPRAEPDLKAYIVWVLGRAGAQPPTFPVSEALDDLWSARDRMSPYGRALALLALDEAKDRRGDELAARLIEEARTTGDLSFWPSDRDPLLFDLADTSVEATATAVRALARRDPRHPVLDRAVRWLMLNRSGGYWFTTKQTAMALYALVELLQARNETPATFSADVYVNGTLVRTETFTPASLTNPDPVVIEAEGRGGQNAVRIVKRGGGTVYWSATAVYFDTQAAEARAGSRQLAVTRRYARLVPVKQANGNIVYREQALEGPIEPGDVLTVRLTTAGSKDWRYLVLEDPLPAGVEAIQDTTAFPLERRRTDAWGWPQSEYRDTRTVFFQRTFDQGRYEFMYLVKAIASGVFSASPAQIAPMYVPGVAASSEPFMLTVGQRQTQGQGSK